ncbi:Ig-like domain-containing protein [Gracilimonas mengyeensis]|uniref:Ig-like domain-containing protein n=1 Tax=Gracilimonas mengyeensis TaxID=1302730 RepID=A0A521DI20_9BACT|nr:Ig-like domain-containing protein [Gracilimonas mengyeensis]SMO71235.1 Ig-like domain-containing protein [Gracilimonas mengyeensis]
MNNRYEKVRKISGLIAIALLTLVSGCKDRSVGVEGYCPIVESTSPSDGASDVQTDAMVTVTFEEEINPETFDQEAFSLTSPNGEVSGTISYNEETQTVNFTPDSPLATGTNYTGTVDNTVEDPLGNQMLEEYVWNFTTETPDPGTPIIVSTTPGNGDTGIALNTEVSADFNMMMDASTISESSFTLTDGNDNAVDGTVEYSDSTAVFTPAASLENGTTYTASITTDVTSDEGTAIEDNYTWSFTTVEAGLQAPIVDFTDPADGDTGVALSSNISATFTEATDPRDIEADLFNVTFTIEGGGQEVEGVITYDGLTAEFEPNEDLVPGTTYNATVTTSVKGESNEEDMEVYEWSFTTVDEGLQAPIVDFTDPADGETSVALNTNISATFTNATDPRDIEADLFTVDFTVEGGGEQVDGVVTYDGLTAEFEPNEDLAPGTTYNATVTTGVKGESNEEDMEVYEWSFTTASIEGLQAPVVDFTDPVNGETNVALDKTISATFTPDTDPRALELSLISVEFVITNQSNGETITGDVFYDVDNLMAYFDPDEELEEGVIYEGQIITSVKGDNNATDTEIYGDDEEWVFATNGLQAPIVDFTDPVNGETNVATDKTISATFTPDTDPRMLELSLISAEFVITNQSTGETITGNVFYDVDELMAYFDPDEDLEPGTTYEGRVITSVIGDNNASDTEIYGDDEEWTFTTQ